MPLCRRRGNEVAPSDHLSLLQQIPSHPKSFMNNKLSYGRSGWIPGKLIGPNDRYKIIKAITDGGCSEIFAAVDQQSGKVVTVKFVVGNHPETFNTEVTALQMFQDQPKSNIVQLIDHFDRQCMVIEFLDGYDLSAVMSQRQFSMDEVRQYAKLLLVAIKSLHDRNLTHCDLKPANVLVSADGRKLRLADSARVRREHDSGSVDYKPCSYRAPEMIREKSLGSKAADMWALGCILVEMATREVLFGRGFATAEDRLRRIESIVPNLRDWLQDHGCTDAILSDLIIGCLHLRASERISIDTAIGIFPNEPDLPNRETMGVTRIGCLHSFSTLWRRFCCRSKNV